MENSHEHQKNQQEFRAILAKYQLTQDQAAQLITTQTYKSLKGRTIRTWLANPSASTARKCPTWAVAALRQAVESGKNSNKYHNASD